MSIYLDDGDVRLHLGDCVEVMAAMPAESVDAIVCDPPYGLEFMGKEWDSFGNDGAGPKARFSGTGYTDGGERLERPSFTGGGQATCANCGGDRYRGVETEKRRRCRCDAPSFPNVGKIRGSAFQAWCETWATEALRVLKPGGHMLAFGGTRTFHRLTCAIEDAGFEIRDSIGYGHMRRVYCGCSPTSPVPYGYATDETVRGLRDTDHEAAVVLEGADRADVQSPMQRRPSGPGVGDARAQGPGGMDGRLSGVVPGEDERRAEPGLEGRGDVLQDARGVHGSPVRPGAGVGAADGSSGRVRHGASPSDGEGLRLPADEDRGGASPGPRPVEQLADESGALAVEWIPQGGGAWPACPRCHLPLEPPFDAGPLAWEYGSGFPKSHDVSKAIDKAAGATREVVGRYQPPNGQTWNLTADQRGGDLGAPTGLRSESLDTAPATPEAAKWQGWGTALKPAWEPIVVARKPLGSTVAANVLRHGTGALNIDGCRIGTTDDLNGGAYSGDRRDGRGVAMRSSLGRGVGEYDQPAGRWPANVVLDEAAAERLDAEVGELTSGANPTWRGSDKFRTAYGDFEGQRECHAPRGTDTGGPSRFYYTAKASTAERDGATHPTVKPLALMRWCVRLVTPPGGVVLDCFAGSGTTLLAARDEGFRAIGIEREEEYARMIVERYRRRFDPGAAEWGGTGDDGVLSLFGDAA